VAEGGAGPSEHQAEQAERHGAGNRARTRKDKKPPRGSTRSRVTINEERVLKVDAPPGGSRFKGYASYVVPDW
jgi:hypothetical protein